MAGIDLGEPGLETSVRAGLERVEEQLRAAVGSADPLVAEAARHLVEAGGKRLRPLLVLLTAHFGDPGAPGVAESAVVVELTHLATLYHDDVMDEAAVRRGAPSANSRWGNSVAILTGDYLFARASDIVADLGPEAVRIQARTFSRLVTGQIRETAGPLEGADRVEHYLHVLTEKTASLIATCGRFGAMFAGVGADDVENLTRFCEIVGVAYQLSDDLLDIASEQGQSGKTPGTDLREGVATLPVLYALRTPPSNVGDRDAARLRALAAGPLTDDALHREALELLRRSPAMETARGTLRSYAEEARGLLAGLPPAPARAALESLVDVIVDRTG